MTTRTKDNLISVREAAKECGRNMETVRRWIWGGKLPAQKLGNQLFIKRSDFASFCRETVVREYKAEAKPDFLERAIALQKKLRARGVRPINAAEEIRKMREERMNQIEQSLKETAEALHKKDALLDFLKEAKAIRNEIHARTGEVFDAEAMIRELRDGREHELG
jgi:excisionase family DNA binding protein